MSNQLKNRLVPKPYAVACTSSYQRQSETGVIKLPNPTNLVAFSADGVDPIGNGIPFKDWVDGLPDDSYTDVTVQFGIYVDPSPYNFGDEDKEFKAYLNSVIGRLTVFLIPCNKVEVDGKFIFEQTQDAFNLGELNP